MLFGLFPIIDGTLRSCQPRPHGRPCRSHTSHQKKTTKPLPNTHQNFTMFGEHLSVICAALASDKLGR